VAYIDEHRARVVAGRPLGVEPIIEVLRTADVEITPEQLLRREEQGAVRACGP
jgi:hypothetical protein